MKVRHRKINESIKNIVLSEYKKGNIVVNTHEGLMMAKLTEVINQPAEGLLYDLNRDEMTILTFIDDPKWINDYACMAVIRKLKKQLDQQQWEIDNKFISNICLSYRHDFGLLNDKEKDAIVFECKEWIRAIENNGAKILSKQQP